MGFTDGPRRPTFFKDGEMAPSQFTDETRARGAATRSARTLLTPQELISAAKLSGKPAQIASIKEKLLEMPNRYMRGYLKAVRGRSLRAAVGAYCLECVGWERESVRCCTSLGCPLYPYRPYKGPLE